MGDVESAYTYEAKAKRDVKALSAVAPAAWIMGECQQGRLARTSVLDKTVSKKHCQRKRTNGMAHGVESQALAHPRHGSLPFTQSSKALLLASRLRRRHLFIYFTLRAEAF